MMLVLDNHINTIYKIHRLSRKDINRYRKHLSEAKYRILVSGSRGKSGLVEDIYGVLHGRELDVLGKVTGSDPKIFYMGVTYYIDRGSNPKRFFLDYENAGIIADFKADIYCFENQTISRYTNGYIHFLFKPHIEIIPNLRLEHAELGESLEEMAHTFGATLKNVDYAIYAEPIPHNKERVIPILREYASKFGVELRIIDIPYSESMLPGVERVYILQELLDIMGLPPLTYHEYNEVINRVVWEIKPRVSSYGFYYVDLSKVNDPDTTSIALEYLKKNYVMGRPIYILAYFRGDRIDRTKFFIPFFERIRDDDSVAKVILGGMYYDRIKKILGDKALEMKKIDMELLFEKINDEDGFLILAVNGVTFEMDMVREMLSRVAQPAV